MGLRDRAKSGLAKRLMADEIYEPLALLFAEASYPSTPPQPGLPRPIVSPSEAGRIIDQAIMLSQNDDRQMIARLLDPEAAAEARAQTLAKRLYGLSAGALAEVAFGPGAADLMGLDFPERPAWEAARQAQARTAPPPAPGWYPDPSAPGMRWWDGSQWTPHFRPNG